MRCCQSRPAYDDAGRHLRASVLHTPAARLDSSDCCVGSGPFTLQMSLMALPSRTAFEACPTLEWRFDLHRLKLSTSTHVTTLHRASGTVIVITFCSSNVFDWLVLSDTFSVFWISVFRAGCGCLINS